MKKPRNMFVKNIRYLCLVGVIAVGLVSIVATGGGDGGGGGTTTDTTQVDIVEETDDLRCVVSVDGDYSFRWYRNDILLSQETDSLLTNEAMRTFDGNPAEYTPASSHTGHTVTGYKYTCEVLDQGSILGIANLTISGSLFDGLMKGANCSFFQKDNATPEKTDNTLAALKRTNINWVSIWPLYFQDDIDSTVIYEGLEGDPNTITETQLVYAIDKAHELDLRVVFYPQIWIKYPDGSVSPHGRDSIVPSDDWFAAYKEFIINQADIAELTGADLFAIGVELQSTEDYTEKWLDIISSVRDHYGGPIVYSALACYQGGFERLKDIEWFASLDYIGLSSNLETQSGDYDPTISELVAHYQTMAATMKEIHDAFGKPVIFLETSTDSLDGATSGLYYSRNDVPDFQEQADYYDAFFQTFADKSWVAGIFWNNWHASQETWYKDDACWPFGVTFLNKPAERVLTSWYGGIYGGDPGGYEQGDVGDCSPPFTPP